ncbi:type II secretion system protein, partial [Patescibacteria group bacterium]
MSARQPIFGFRISAQTLKVCFYRPSRSVLYGFTLIELLVSIGIFAVITGFMLSNFRAGQKQDETRFAAEFAAGVIREALTRATAGA